MFLLTFTSLLAVTAALSCQKCESGVVRVNDVFMADQNNPTGTTECVEKVCGEGEDVCSYGYATVSFKGQRPIGQSGDSSGNDGIDLEVEMVMNWFKDCASSATATCETVSDFLKMAVSEDSSLDVSKCDIQTCDTDNCNDIPPASINPDPATRNPQPSINLQQIYCYSCKKSTVNGVADADPSNPDQPDCNENHRKLCPLGVDFCLSGNFELTVVGELSSNETEVDYMKDCGSSFMASCAALEQTMDQASLYNKNISEVVMRACNIQSCAGDLCNTMSAQEVQRYRETDYTVGSGAAGSGKNGREKVVLSVMLVTVIAIL